MRLSQMCFRLSWGVLGMLVWITPQLWADDYDDFNAFCRGSFGAERESLVYASQGNTLTEVATGSWTYASRNSACIAWETNLPATGRVEYGLTVSYGQASATEERPFYRHIHHLTGLTAGTTYHYRVVSVDERGNTLAGEDRTIATQLMPAAIELPGSLGASPFWLDQDHATYILTQDITAPSTAFNVHGTNITLDLNGHTVTYDHVSGAADNLDSATYWAIQGPHAVREGYNASVRVFNGRIVQGAGMTTGTVEGTDAYNNAIAQPVYGAEEVAGVCLEYASDHNTGLTYAGHVHHCAVTDRGSVIHNRHLGVSGIESAANVHHTLIKRVRHKGITSTQASNNELYMDSQATNSIGLNALQSDQTYEYNKIFGTGYHVVAVGWNLNDSNHITVRRNLIHLVGKAPEPGWAEYGDQVSLNGIRLTQYGGGTDVYRGWVYEDNVISIYVKGSAYLNGAWNACEGRGIQLASDPTVYDFVVRNNTIKVIADESDPHITNASCIVAQGLSDRMETAEPIYYRNNTLISNFTHVRFGDYYTCGSNHRFEDCTFIKTGSDSRYHTFYGGFWTQNSARHVVQDGIFQGGASPDSIAWEGSGTRDYTVAWTLDLTTSPGATVIVKDALGQLEHVGTADGLGKAYPVLAQWLMQPDASNQNVANARNPHSVLVKLNGLEGSGTVSVTQIGQTLTLYPTLSGGENTPPTVSLSAPANHLEISPYTELTIAAAADDTDGAVVKTECFVNGTLLGEDTAAPYRWTRMITQPGTYAITVRATDDEGAHVTTSAITVNCVARVIQARWNLDEGNGTLAADSLGTAHGTVSGAQWVTGYKGGALRFTGNDDTVALPPAGFSGNQNEVTLAMWVSPQSWGSGGTLFDESDGEYWQFNVTDTVWRTRDISTGETGARDNDLALPSLSNGQWQHLAFVYSTTNGTKTIYRNGQVAAVVGTSVDRLTTGRSDAAIGNARDGAAFSGAIDEVHFFNRALSGAEIQNLMEGMLPLPENSSLIFGSRNVLAYPNPAHGKVYFAIKETAAEKLAIHIYNLTGERIARIEKDHPGQIIAWNAAGIAPGVYLYRVILTKDGKETVLPVGKVAIIR